jgi:hypothetical protein
LDANPRHPRPDNSAGILEPSNIKTNRERHRKDFPMRLFSTILIGLLMLFSFGCGGPDGYKEREAEPNIDDEVLVDDPAMGGGPAAADTK